ncbi:DUF1223 domain-containing protein [Aurantimonas sp. Leaf443]|uniref:DUF1223 domain-containing protein n=1 Tax=Aurantimonas sp. Leaf443 TaxID=1736378 RepID=UPI00070107A5|nr:DUF1223 domain-containing protein [Aurantimonas sp. Leaf443]KQT82239.1 hypothetical protein ASG48_16545 [Aurantimonas sp. Leaf443]
MRRAGPTRSGTAAAGTAALRMLLLAASLSTIAPQARAEPPKARPVTSVVELFTSQGCVSCPPADRLFAKLADEPGILALAYHVDYWDYIGWRDTYGSRENTDRQRGYSRTFDNAAIYTPQAVVNGRREVVGSHESELRRAIAAAPLDPGRARIDLTLVGDKLHIEADAPGSAGGPAPVLMLVTFDDRREVAINRGENRDRTTVNVHAVHDWRILGQWSGEPLEVDIPVSMVEFPGKGRVGTAAILQVVTEKGTPGPILAATYLEWDRQ